MAGVVLLGLLASSALGAEPACRELRERRDGLTAQAMQAEIALVMALRRQLCPREEQAHAEATPPSPEARSGDPPTLDYAAYIRCRERAEARLRRRHPVRYRNGRGFVFYTQAGAGLARAADALQPEIAQACASTTPPEPRRR